MNGDVSKRGILCVYRIADLSGQIEEAKLLVIDLAIARHGHC